MLSYSLESTKLVNGRAQSKMEKGHEIIEQ